MAKRTLAYLREKGISWQRSWQNDSGSLEKQAEKVGYKEVGLSAQTRVQQFYEKLGYRAYGDVYKDEYCPHIAMKKTLSGE